MDNKIKSMIKKCNVVANHLLDMASEFKTLGHSLEKHNLDKEQLEKVKRVIDNKITKCEEFMK